MNRSLITLLTALLVLGFAGSASAHHVTQDGRVPVHPECATPDGACPESNASDDTVKCGALEDDGACGLGDENGADETDRTDESDESDDAVQG